MFFTFWDDDYPSEKHKILDTNVDSTGTIAHSNDNTKWF